MSEFKALVVKELEDGTYASTVETVSTDSLPEGDVLIKVDCSSLNYKDALSFSGNKGVTRNFPHTPGIDAVGSVAESSTDEFAVGDQVLVVGYDLGMNTSGGFGEYIRVPKNWVMSLPKAMSAKNSMAWGTAGFTAALCVEKLLNNGVKPEDGAVLVSGSTGGVGSVAIMLLNKLGFEVHAMTGKAESSDYLIGLGAKTIVARSEFEEENKRPMLKPVYAAAVDTAGGAILGSILKLINYGGAVACCGLAASPALNTTVLPFILRSVDLLGVDSVELPLEKKKQVWSLMASDWQLADLESQCQVISKDQLADTLPLFVQGKVQGRYILDHSL